MDNKTNGFLIINKPAGITSHDVVNQVRRVSGIRQTGHAGTLDPFATGVLVVAVGSATRLLEYVRDLPKTYQAEITLGARSTTDDLTGIITPVSSRQPAREEVEATLLQFTGQLQQVPPAYAAIKVQGKKLYEYARKGERVERKPRPVTIYAFRLLSYQYPALTAEIKCSAGTYIRSLGRDLGDKLGVGGYVSQLERKVIHMFHISMAIDPHKLSPDSLTALLSPPERLIDHFPTITLNPENVAKFKRGQVIALTEAKPAELADKPLAIFDESHALLGIGHYDAITTLLHPKKVL